MSWQAKSGWIPAKPRPAKTIFEMTTDQGVVEFSEDGPGAEPWTGESLPHLPSDCKQTLPASQVCKTSFYVWPTPYPIVRSINTKFRQLLYTVPPPKYGGFFLPFLKCTSSDFYPTSRESLAWNWHQSKVLSPMFSVSARMWLLLNLPEVVLQNFCPGGTPAAPVMVLEKAQQEKMPNSLLW